MRPFKRKLLRFSLRSALCLFLVTGMVSGWLGRNIREHMAEQSVIAEIRASKVYSPPVTDIYNPTNPVRIPIFVL